MITSVYDCPVCGSSALWPPGLVGHIYPATGEVVWHVRLVDVQDNPLSWLGRGFYHKPEAGPPADRVIAHGELIYCS